jgi:hypothetical protein
MAGADPARGVPHSVPHNNIGKSGLIFQGFFC